MLEEIVQLARSILFPGYYGNSSVNMQTIRYRIGVDVERLHQLLCQQIMAGLCFAEDHHDCPTTSKEVKQQAEVIATQLIARLPTIRRILATDIVAA